MPDAPGTPPAPGVSPRLTLTLAAATGVSVANIYYAQPLLHTLALEFSVEEGTAGLIVTLTQLGYAAGLVLLVPLGDLLDRRRLATAVSSCTAVALLAAALSPGVGVFFGACLAIGLTSVVAQVLVPMAAGLARPENRGKVVGRVMSGLLIGILLARTASGLVSDALGWRWVFGLAAAAMLVQAAALRRALPPGREPVRMSYPRLLGSVLEIVREEPVLRSRIAQSGCAFAAFSVFWTAVAFLLARPPWGWSDAAIGALGLVGAAGAASAAVAGRVSDAGHGRPAAAACIAMVIGSFVLMGSFPFHLAAIVGGVVLLDVGQSGLLILNQGTIYALRPEARSRVTTAFMTGFFCGGVAGSAAAGYAFTRFGWTGVCVIGSAFGLASLAAWIPRGSPTPAAAHPTAA